MNKMDLELLHGALVLKGEGPGPLLPSRSDSLGASSKESSSITLLIWRACLNSLKTGDAIHTPIEAFANERLLSRLSTVAVVVV